MTKPTYHLTCFDCGGEMKHGDKAYELTVGTINDDFSVTPHESLEAWCEKCEEKRGER